MPLMRCTFFFEDDNKHGWSETLHSLKPDLTATLQAAQELLPLRRNLLGSTARISMIRVSDDLIKRDSRIILIPPGDGTSRTSGDASADIANTSLVIRIEAVNPISRRTLYMRGFPDQIVSRSGRYANVGMFQDDFDVWSAQIEFDDWAIKSRDKTTPQTLIFSISQDPATGLITVTTSAAHGLQQGEAVTVRGVKGTTVLNGSYVPFGVPSPTTFTVKTFSLIQPYLGEGYVQRLGYTLAAARDPRIVRVSHRIAGRPFDSPVGRRKVR